MAKKKTSFLSKETKYALEKNKVALVALLALFAGLLIGMYVLQDPIASGSQAAKRKNCNRIEAAWSIIRGNYSKCL